MGEKGPVVMAEHVMDSWEGGVLAQLASCAESAESAEKRKSTWRECSHGKLSFIQKWEKMGIPGRRGVS